MNLASYYVGSFIPDKSYFGFDYLFYFKQKMCAGYGSANIVMTLEGLISTAVRPYYI